MVKAQKSFKWEKSQTLKNDKTSFSSFVFLNDWLNNQKYDT